MNSDSLDVPSLASNPFSTRFISPTVANFLFPEGSDAECLIAKLRRSGWWGQVIGPHGSGKSALLYTLVPRMERAGRRVQVHVLHESERRLKIERGIKDAWNCHTQVVVDGYEQLGWFSRMQLKRICRSRGAGLLVTAHLPVGLPELWVTETTLELAQALVARLLPPQRASWITFEDVARAFSDCHGNLREMLLSLYDVFEDRANQSPEWD